MSKKYEKLKPYLKKIGSGEFTGKSLNREESTEATKLILKEEASPAQIGAFMIAHRIRAKNIFTYNSSSSNIFWYAF